MNFFSRKPDSESEPVGAAMPHCDQTILHSPGSCVYCDKYPEWQALRDFWRINFTDEEDPYKAPCPSTFFRTPHVRDLWGGNVARPHAAL